VWDVDENFWPPNLAVELVAKGVVEVLAVVAGLTLVLATAGDAVSTVVTTRRRRGRFWPTPVYYRWSWRAWRAVGQRAAPELREGFLGSYGPLSLLGLACHAAGGVAGIAAAFADWERWCDGVYDSHTTYPMLALFRSRQPGQHWLTGLGVVIDAAAISLAAIDGARAGPAARLWRRASRLLQNFGELPAVGLRETELAGSLGDEGRFRAAYQRLGRLGLPLRPYGEAWEELRRLRAGYYPELVAATELLLVPLEFRHQTARLDSTRSG
jgi:hypothetical protein